MERVCKQHMKRKKIKAFYIILIICISFCVFFLSKNSKENSTKIVETSTKQAEVTRRTIVTTLTASGEVTSGTVKKLSLNTNYYYWAMCVEENEYISKGSNILKYTNGTYLTAPYNCVITEYSVPSVNNICTEDNYIQISSLDDLYMDLNISEDQLSKVSVGQEVEIVVNYNEDVKYTGVISKINAIGTSGQSGTSFGAIVSLTNDGTLKLGMSASCTVTLEKSEDILALPIEAVQVEGKEKYVMLSNETGNTEKVKIETGKADANYVEVVSGISEKSKVNYETTTVTNISTSTNESSSNGLSSLFNFGGRGNRGGMSR